MCGIVGYVGDKSAVGIIVEGLKRLEYRGYDSAGIAVYNDGTLHVRRAPGRLKMLENVLGHVEALSREYEKRREEAAQRLVRP